MLEPDSDIEEYLLTHDQLESQLLQRVRDAINECETLVLYLKQLYGKRLNEAEQRTSSNSGGGPVPNIRERNQ